MPNIETIRLHYRISKAAQTTRIRMDHGLVSFARCYLTAWKPDADAKTRKREALLAKETVKALIKGKVVETDLGRQIGGMVFDIAPARNQIKALEKENRKIAEKLAEQLPVYNRIQHIRGFGVWGVCCIIGEAGDLDAFSGRRKLYKYLGLAPDECYKTGKDKPGRKGGRMIPRSTRGRIMGCIGVPLFNKQWAAECGPAGEKIKKGGTVKKGDPGNTPAHPTGPYGQVYYEAHARALASGKTRGHAHKLGRRVMVKALLHDVWAAWHGLELTFAKPLADAAD